MDLFSFIILVFEVSAYHFLLEYIKEAVGGRNYELAAVTEAPSE